MDRRFQRVDAISNTHVGDAFERSAQEFFAAEGIILQRSYRVRVGHAITKWHRFDLGSQNPPVLVECKSYSWTRGRNTPSAKIRALNETMLLFTVSPMHYRKCLIMLRHLRKEETLATYYLRTQGHLIPLGVEIWELDIDTVQGQRLLS